MNDKTIKIIKYVALGVSLVSTVVTAWVDTKENEIILKKLVDEHFKNN